MTNDSSSRDAKARRGEETRRRKPVLFSSSRLFASSRLRVSAFLFCLLAASARANTATGTHGMVASVHPVATDAGLAVLKAGGNAIDAAVAVGLTLGVVDGHNSGVGGGCFMLVHLADGSFVCLDGREMAPAAATRDMFLRNGKADTSLSQTGALASGVPGSLAVYDYATKHFGKKPFADSLNTAAQVAEKGFEIDRKYASKLKNEEKEILLFPETKRVLMKPDGSPYAAGDVLKQPDLAASLRAIATQGIAWFYGGEFAIKLDAWMKSNAGLLTREDFAGYQMKLREPVVSQYRGHTIVGFPPASSGGVHVAQILSMMDHFDIAALEKRDPALRVHVISEAMKLAFADRAYWLGDPDFAKVPKKLVDPDYCATLAKQIKLDSTLQGITHGTPADFDTEYFGKHTTHLTVVDDAGNWVAMTQTVNTGFGSKVIIPGTGIVLNNQMDDFAIQPGVPNYFGLIGAEANAVGPRKRPLSAMSPTIVLKDGKPVLTVGAAGGPKIITQVVLLISNVLDLGDDLGTAIERPRFHHQWSPDEMWIEKKFPESVMESLKSLGHKLAPSAPAGATNAIQLNDGVFTGASEPRVPGKAAGY